MGGSMAAGLRHFLNSTKGDSIEDALGRHLLDTRRPNFSAEAESANGFAQERGFFALRFGQGDGDVRPRDGDGDAGETGSGAEVEKGAHTGWDLLCGEEALRKMAAEDGARVAHGGEVDASVPLEKESEELLEVLAGFGVESESCGQMRARIRIGGALTAPRPVLDQSATDSRIMRGSHSAAASTKA